MASGEVIDVSGARSTERRRLLRRVGGPVLGVALVVLSILGIALYSYQSNRAGALTLSAALLDSLQNGISREVGSYVSPATRAVLLARDMVARNAIPNGQQALEGFAASMLNQVPHLEGFYFGDTDGDFLMVHRNPAGGTDTKFIVSRPGFREVTLTHLDPAGKVLDSRTDPNDDYDPRTRVWFKGALGSEGVFWSPPYVFFTTRAPGITASVRVGPPGENARVFGVDITLEDLSIFLASLHIGRAGRAAIISRDGTVIAAPNLSQHPMPKGGTAELNALAALNDPALTAAYDRFRVDGFGNHRLTVGDTPYTVIASRLPAAGEDWVLLLVAPESDFTAVADSTSRRNLLLSLITIGLASLLGLVLIRQNRRADLLAAELAQERDAEARGARALATLTADPGLLDPEEPAPGLTEQLAAVTGARRASLWQLTGDDHVLRCADSFESQDGGGHTEGLELSRSEIARFFELLLEGRAVELRDAAADPRTRDVHRLLMRPFESQSLSVTPVRGPDGPLGAVLLEDAADLAGAGGLLSTVASIAAARFAEQERRERAPQAAEPAFAEPAPEPINAPAGAGAYARGGALIPSAIDVSAPGIAFFPTVAAMSLRIDAGGALAQTRTTGSAALADELARALQAIAARQTLSYMKLVGDHLVAAAGCTETPDPSAAMRLADAALAARETCFSLLAGADGDPGFRIGIDLAPAFGGALGDEPRVFNLWGEAITTAELLAGTVTDSGAIQVSEQAYEQLRHLFLFRPRGLFFRPGVGAARTFILAGRR